MRELDCDSGDVGASAPYKPWRICSMKKIGRKVFWEVRGKIKYYNSAFLIYCMLYQKCSIIIFNFPLNLPTRTFSPLECSACICNISLMQNYNSLILVEY